VKILYKKIYIAILFIVFTAGAAFCAEKPILVTQPAYHSMNFYIFKPANLPGEFYSTFDGYLVYKDAKGVWHYASAEKSGIKKTGYVVGSVIPSVVKLKPYDANISSVAPVLGTDKVSNSIPIKPAGALISPNENISLELNTREILEIDVTPITAPEFNAKNSSKNQYTPPASNYIQNTQGVMQNSDFMAISKWQNTVDRMGVLDNPKIPVAWKGEYPEVIYAWTGIQWYQISPRQKHSSALNIIRRENYNLVVHANKANALNWNDNDSYILSQYAMRWGYQWLGEISINKED